MSTTVVATRQVPSGASTGSTSVTFSIGDMAKTVTVNNANILSTSGVLISVSVPSTRDLDEMEFVNFQTAYGNIVNATSFDIIISADPSCIPEGTFKVDYQILN